MAHRIVAAGLFERPADCVQFRLAQMLDADEFVAGMTDRSNQLIELGLDRASVPVLSILDQEHHQECDDGGAGVDHQLPCVRPLEYRA